MIADRIDRWVGNLFKPMVVWLCQRTGLTQYAVYRYGWMLVAMINLWSLTDGTNNPNLWWTVFVGLWAILVTCAAALAPNLPPYSDANRWWIKGFRLMFISLAALHILWHITEVMVTGSYTWHTTCPVDLLVLLAEYAATIDTIPPRKIKEKKKAPALSRVGA